MMVAIVRQAHDGDTVSLGKIASVTNMSRRYMEQLAIALKSASLIVALGPLLTALVLWHRRLAAPTALW